MVEEKVSFSPATYSTLVNGLRERGDKEEALMLLAAQDDVKCADTKKITKLHNMTHIMCLFLDNIIQ
ncbi:hypothetical protein PTKIN_Ptkin09bG0126000 [Pterospermum kingtungense]